MADELNDRMAGEPVKPLKLKIIMGLINEYEQ